MYDYLSYILLIFTALADHASTIFALNKKMKEYGNIKDALTHEKNPYAREVYTKHGLKEGFLRMALKESILLVILGFVLETFQKGDSFVLVGFMMGIPLNNVYRTYNPVKNTILSELLKTIFIGIFLGIVALLISAYAGSELTAKFILGAALFLVLSPFFDFFYKHIFPRMDEFLGSIYGRFKQLFHSF